MAASALAVCNFDEKDLPGATGNGGGRGRVAARYATLEATRTREAASDAPPEAVAVASTAAPLQPNGAHLHLSEAPRRQTKLQLPLPERLQRVQARAAEPARVAQLALDGKLSRDSRRAQVRAEMAREQRRRLQATAHARLESAGWKVVPAGDSGRRFRYEPPAAGAPQVLKLADALRQMEADRALQLARRRAAHERSGGSGPVVPLPFLN